MAKVKNEFHDDIEIRALFAADSNISSDEAFEILSAEGVDDIAHICAELNRQYAQWQYFNLK